MIAGADGDKHEFVEMLIKNSFVNYAMVSQPLPPHNATILGIAAQQNNQLVFQALFHHLRRFCYEGEERSQIGVDRLSVEPSIVQSLLLAAEISNIEIIMIIMSSIDYSLMTWEV